MSKIDPSLLKWVCPVNPRYKNKCYSRRATSTQTSKKLLAYQQFVKSHMKGKKFASIDAVNEAMREIAREWKRR